MDEYTRLLVAQREFDAAKKKLKACERNVASIEMKFREALPIGEHVPYTVAVLPSGKVAVHVWVDYSDEPNQLHIVTPGYYTEDAKPRKKFPSEQLGDGK